MKRFAVILAASLALVGTAAVVTPSASAKTPIYGYVEDGSGPCGPWGYQWTTHYTWFDGTYYRFHHTTYACAPWGIEVIREWDT